MNDKMTTGNGPNRKRRKYQEDYRLGNVKMMIQQEEWLREHPDYHKKWRKRNPKYYLHWRKKNPEYFKNWLEDNADHRRSYMTEYMRKYRKAANEPAPQSGVPIAEPTQSE